jgi:T-complex protein 1 subunit eta
LLFSLSCHFLALRSSHTQVGDGTTSVVVLACEFLTAAKYCIEEGIHPQVIIKHYRQAATLAKGM